MLGPSRETDQQTEEDREANVHSKNILLARYKVAIRPNSDGRENHLRTAYEEYYQGEHTFSDKAQTMHNWPMLELPIAL